MQGSRSLLHLTMAFGASYGAWLGVGEPTLGLSAGIIYGMLCGAVIGKVLFGR